jgi:serine protease Do
MVLKIKTIMKNLLLFVALIVLIQQSCNDRNLNTGALNTRINNDLNFIHAANLATPAVVHINTYAKTGSTSPLEELFRGHLEQERQRQKENPPQEGMQLTGSGSGVIIQSNGYIITSYHIIANALRIEVSLNDKRIFTAQVIGTDPSTDLALLKIEANKLQFLEYENNIEIEVGQWIAAVGNPFNLTSTVTAGIVSAKGRYLNIIGDSEGRAIESFIQTDAALNPGNSGGALVNMNGELVGINAAIASPTGVFAGYSFAVPMHLVQKVVTDILEFGEVKRGVLGVRIRDLDVEMAEKYKIKNISGAIVEEVIKESSAEIAGIKNGDIIVAIEGREITSAGELQEIISLKRPGEKVRIAYKRNGKTKEIEVALKK